MPKAKKKIKIRDQKPAADPKGGHRGHGIGTKPQGVGTDRHGFRHRER